jgi:hypothetical protein
MRILCGNGAPGQLEFYVQRTITPGNVPKKAFPTGKMAAF